jgi:hypothetical protein
MKQTICRGVPAETGRIGAQNPHNLIRIIPAGELPFTSRNTFAPVPERKENAL